MRSIKSTVASLILLAIFQGATHAAQRPNILFAIADDMSHASAYGYKFLDTPNFDRVARDGILFNRAYTPSSKCAPSRSVIITGRNPWQLEEAANHQPYFPAKFKSVVESLGEQGYFTGFTGKGWGPGNAGDRELTGTDYSQIKVKSTPASGINKIDYAANFDQFLKQKPNDRPFFFWYGCKEPHRGYEYQSGQKLGKKISDLDFSPKFWGDDERVQNDILDYAVEVEYFDMHLGRILKSIEAAGELDNTIVIVTSDNGMPFPRFKGHPYEHSTHLPLTIMWNGKIKQPGRQSDAFVSFIDFAPTFLQIAGVSQKKSGLQSIQGASLFDVFAGKPNNRNRLLTGRERNDIGRPHEQGYPVRSLHQGNFVYMHNFEPTRWPCGNPETGYRDTDGSPTKTFTLTQGAGSFEYEKCYGIRPREELYNLETDPECVSNLANLAMYAFMKEAMKSELFAELKKQGDPRMLGNGSVFDKYTHSKQAGYYEKFMANQKKKTPAKSSK
ncbi:MAG: heparan N-sulfatase [Blastopirellula sp.]|nr:MAG: heparan N-sulfatase [Blastopirellula sp.]